MPKKWMQNLHLKKGASDLGIPQDKKIPSSILGQAAKSSGKVGKRARLALTFKHARQ